MTAFESSLPDRRGERTVQFWTELERNVAARVDAALHRDKALRGAVIDYLRDVETMARAECDRRQTIQIIASGRGVLGDRTPLGPSDGPFSRTA